MVRAKTMSVVLAAGGCFVVLGCSNIRVVEVQPGHGGVVALLGSRDQARTKAEQYMTGQCPSGYDIVEEGESVVGSRTQGSSSAVGGNGFAVGSSSSTSRNLTEWRIHYQCKAGVASGHVQELVVWF